VFGMGSIKKGDYAPINGDKGYVGGGKRGTFSYGTCVGYSVCQEQDLTCICRKTKSPGRRWNKDRRKERRTSKEQLKQNRQEAGENIRAFKGETMGIKKSVMRRGRKKLG